MAIRIEQSRWILCDAMNHNSAASRKEVRDFHSLMFGVEVEQAMLTDLLFAIQMYLPIAKKPLQTGKAENVNPLVIAKGSTRP